MYNGGVKRWTFNTSCVISLLIFLASIALWVRTYFASDEFERKSWSSGRESFSVIYTTRGIINIGLGREMDKDIHSTGGWPWTYHLITSQSPLQLARSPDDRLFLRLGSLQFQHRFRTTGHGWDSVSQLTLPIWIFLPTIIPPLLWWRRWRRRQIRGFPIDATPDSPVYSHQ
jgi:hypothetical protein